MWHPNPNQEQISFRRNPRLVVAGASTCLFFFLVLSMLSYRSKVAIPLDIQNEAIEKQAEKQEQARVDKAMPTDCWKASRRKEKPGQARGIPVQYVHVPKAGGTTIQESLIEWARKLNVPVYLKNGDHDKGWKCPGQVDRGILMGHRGFGFCDRMQKKYGQSALYMVALREPVSRFRSLFDYFMDNDYPQFAEYHSLWDGRELSELVVEAQKILNMKLPVTDPRMRGPIRFLELSRHQLNFMCGWDCVNLKSNFTMDERLDRALDNLRRTDIVVVMEKLDEMILQMKFHSYLVPPDLTKFPMENTHKGKKSELTAEATAIITEWSKKDTIVYEMAKLRHKELTDIARHCLEGHGMQENESGPGDDDDA